jgi:hypothetical protein
MNFVYKKGGNIKASPQNDPSGPSFRCLFSAYNIKDAFLLGHRKNNQMNQGKLSLAQKEVLLRNTGTYPIPFRLKQADSMAHSWATVLWDRGRTEILHLFPRP